MAVARPSIPALSGALSGVIVVFGFVVLHDVLISDIWFNAVPMVFVGALCGTSIVWSYRTSVAEHSTASWYGYAGFYVAELILLGAVSLLILRPQFSMAELMVADDAFERLLAPSMPLMVGSMLVGTLAIWLFYGRRGAALLPNMVTQALLVFFLGHQFAFLGLVETSTELLLVFVEFSVLAVALGAGFCLIVIWSTKVLDRSRPHRAA